MRSVILLAGAALALSLTACTTMPTVPGTDTPVVDPALGPVPAMKTEWVKQIHDTLDAGMLTSFNNAQDDMAARFCPKYKSLSKEGQIHAWTHLMAAMLKYESGVGTDGFIKPGVAYPEPNGVISQGLFQLTYGDPYCPDKQSEGDLNVPSVNIACAMKIMESYLKKDGIVAAGGYVASGAPAPKGLARYWAVIRVPDVNAYKNQRGETVKRKHELAEIQALTKNAPGCI